MFPGFDGLMTLSRREGVDIRPTLLRVLTDLYVQTRVHSGDEERQFIELTSRLIGQVDDATRAAVRARLSIYPNTPAEITKKLGLRSAVTEQPVSRAPAPAPAPYQPRVEAASDGPSSLPMQPKDAAEISNMFFGADVGNRALILHNLAETPLKPSAPIPAPRALRAAQTLEMAAFAADTESFTLEIGEALILPARMAARVVGDPGGEPLACAVKALGISSDVFQRMLIFLPAFGSSVMTVYRLSRLYDRLNERTALIMLAAWRGSTMLVAPPKYRPALYDDERHRARSAVAQPRPSVQSFGVGAVPRNTTRGSAS
jgi:uncharacterized protein DUF2336